MSIESLRAVAKAPTYNCFDEPPSKPGKEARHIQEPREATLHLHYQFTKLLDRVTRPEFLHSATRKRSHITNAEAHKGTDPVVCTDIRKFYESTTRAHVKAFLLNDLRWPIDLACLMADALTIDGHLPTGSAVSPLLSYLSHRSRFAEIERICVESGCVLTLFIDDITISGKRASLALLSRVKQVLIKADLFAHKDRSAPAGSAVIVTGAVRDGFQLRLRNKHRVGIVGLLSQLEAGDFTVEESLTAKVAAAKCVDPVGAAPFERKLRRLTVSRPGD